MLTAGVLELWNILDFKVAKLLFERICTLKSGLYKRWRTSETDQNFHNYWFWFFPNSIKNKYWTLVTGHKKTHFARSYLQTHRHEFRILCCQNAFFFVHKIKKISHFIKCTLKFWHCIFLGFLALGECLWVTGLAKIKSYKAKIKSYKPVIIVITFRSQFSRPSTKWAGDHEFHYSIHFLWLQDPDSCIIHGLFFNKKFWKKKIEKNFL